jgi:hypothetical protein
LAENGDDRKKDPNGGYVMKFKMVLIAALALALASPTLTEGKKKKPPRGMIESMQSMPCGVKQRGLTGLGSIFGSVGIEHVNSNEKLCPQYLLRTDELEYHIRPLDMKHAVILPVGHEAEFKIKKDRLFLKVPDSDKKTRAYQVVSMEPVNSQSAVQGAAYRSVTRPTESRPPEYRPTDKHADRVVQNAPPPR